MAPLPTAALSGVSLHPPHLGRYAAWLDNGRSQVPWHSFLISIKPSRRDPTYSIARRGAVSKIEAPERGRAAITAAVEIDRPGSS